MEPGRLDVVDQRLEDCRAGKSRLWLPLPSGHNLPAPVGAHLSDLQSLARRGADDLNMLRLKALCFDKLIDSV